VRHSNTRRSAAVEAAAGLCSTRSPRASGASSPRGFHEGLDIGLDRRAPVDWALWERHGIFRYGGAIHDVVIESGPFAPDMRFTEG
jgi:hypothetical protein